MRIRRSPRRPRWPLAVALLSIVGLFATLGAWYAYETDERVHFRVEELRAELFDLVNPRPAVLPTPVTAITAPAAPAVNLLPTPTVRPATPTAAAPSATPLTPLPTATATIPPTPLPAGAQLTGFRHEYQKANNCGPASLAVTLSFWGWAGTQVDTAKFLKPNLDDKNVSPIELYNYLTTQGYDAYIRSNGDLETLKRFIAAGYPVLVEKGFQCQAGEARCNGWFGHYSVFTGYDDAKQIFIVQDTFRGPNLKLTYEETERNWRAFNFLYIVPFPAGAERDAEVQRLLGEAVDLEANYRAALQRAQDEVFQLTGEDQAFAWFNIGTNLHYLQDYAGAAKAFDEARRIGLPYRMAWYQFGVYRAYYYTARFQDVVDLATFVIGSTPKPGLEEAYYWRGLAYEALGQRDLAIEDYRTALTWNPTDAEVKEALSRLGAAP